MQALAEYIVRPTRRAYDPEDLGPTFFLQSTRNTIVEELISRFKIEDSNLSNAAYSTMTLVRMTKHAIL